jgi:MerR family transcriptional regulator, copper efflux regulator
MNDESSHLLRIGDLARKSGKTVRAIHLYEELGLLHPATRSSGGFRLFERSALERMRWIDLLHGMGFSLQEMSELLRSWWSADLGPDAMESLRRLFLRKLEETRAALGRYQQLERELTEGLAYLETCRDCATPHVPVRACVRCEQNHGMSSEPALVAGITSTPERPRRGTRGGFVRMEELEKP